MLKRVQKQEVKQDAYLPPDGLEYCLECWKEWINQKGDRDLGAKTMRGLVGEGDGFGNTSVYDAQNANDNRIGAATDAMIDSLGKLHRWAIYKLCSVAQPWNYPHSDLSIIGEQAKDELIKKLRNNCCTSARFN